MLPRLREPVNAFTHLGGAVAAVIATAGLFALVSFSDPQVPWVVSLLVYGLSLCLMFFASGIYHAVSAGPRVTAVLRKLDHSAIYLLIAGTYTPFCVIAFTGFWQWGFLVLIWTLAVVGIVVKLFIIRAPRWITAGVYVVMGWLSVFAIQEMLASLPAASILWLLIGGLTYTAGAVVYITKMMDFYPGLFGFHEVWHIFVILGAVSHFLAVVNLIASVSA